MNSFEYNPKTGYLNGPVDMLREYVTKLTSFINNNTEGGYHTDELYLYNWLTAMDNNKAVNISRDILNKLLNLEGQDIETGATLLALALKKQHWHIAAMPFIFALDPTSFNKYVNTEEEYTGHSMPISAAYNLVNMYLSWNSSELQEVPNFKMIYDWKINNVKNSLQNLGTLHPTEGDLLRSFDVEYSDGLLVAHSVDNLEYIAEYDTLNGKFLANEVISCLKKEKKGIHLLEYKFSPDHPDKPNQNAFFVICNLFHSIMTKGKQKIGNDEEAIRKTTNKIGSKFGKQRQVGSLLESFLDESI